MACSTKIFSLRPALSFSVFGSHSSRWSRSFESYWQTSIRSNIWRRPPSATRPGRSCGRPVTLLPCDSSCNSNVHKLQQKQKHDESRATDVACSPTSVDNGGRDVVRHHCKTLTRRPCEQTG